MLSFGGMKRMTDLTVHLRDAVDDDVPEIARIYGHYVRTTCFTFEEVAPSREEMAARLQRVRETHLPWRVAEAADGGIVGYVYATPFRPRSAYRYTIENSAYVAPEHVRCGIGLTLMRDLMRECTELGYRQMIAVIGDSTNGGSLRLHTRLGFRTIGHQLAVGLKFGRWVDVVQMQMALGEGADSLPAVEPKGYVRG
jgi:phosphinothricin acetyltransferase